MIWKISLFHISWGMQPPITQVVWNTWRRNRSFPPSWALLSFFVLLSQSQTRGRSSNLIPQRQVCTGTEGPQPSNGASIFSHEATMGTPTGGTAGNVLVLFPPADIWSCLLTTHEAANEHCFFFAWGGERYLYVSLESSHWKLYFISSERRVWSRLVYSLLRYIEVSRCMRSTNEVLFSWLLLCFVKASYIHIRVFAFFSWITVWTGVLWLCILFANLECYYSSGVKMLPWRWGEGGEPLCLIDSD